MYIFKSIYIWRKMLNFICHHSWNFRGLSYPTHWHNFSCFLHLRVAIPGFSISPLNSSFRNCLLGQEKMNVFLACRLCLQSCRLCHLKAAVPSYNPSEKELFWGITSTGKCLTMRMLYLCSVSRHGFPECITSTCKSLISYLPTVEILYNKETWLQPHSFH